MNESKLVFYGFNIDYRFMGDGFILVNKPIGCITDEDIELVKSIVDVPDYMVWQSDYQTITIG